MITNYLNIHCYQYYIHYNWREGNDEVDFVIDQKQLIGIEVKSGTTQNTSGMAAFKKKINPDKILLIGNTGLTWQAFLQMKSGELFG